MFKSRTTSIRRYFDTDETSTESLSSDNFWKGSSIDHFCNSSSSSNTGKVGTSSNTYSVVINDHSPDDGYYNGSITQNTEAGYEYIFSKTLKSKEKKQYISK